MTAGLPGLGLGGLFFILSALLAPLVELSRIARGRSAPGAWRAIWRQFAIAVTMLVAIELTLKGVFKLVALAGLGGGLAGGSVSAVPVAAIGITTGLLAFVLIGAKLADLAFRARAQPIGALVPARLPSRTAMLAGATACAVAFFLLLLAGASDLSPVFAPDRAPPSIAGEAQTGEVGAGRPSATARDLPRGEADAIGDPLSNPGASSNGDSEVHAPGNSPFPGAGAGPGPQSGSGSGTPPPSAIPGDTGAGLGVAGGQGTTGGSTTSGNSGSPGPPASAAPPASAGPPTSAGASGNGPPAGAGSGTQGPPAGAGPPEGAGPPTTSGAPSSAGPPADAGPPAAGALKRSG